MLEAGPVQGHDAAQERAGRITAATQARLTETERQQRLDHPSITELCSHSHHSSLYPEAALELLADEVEDYGIDAGVDGGQIYTQVIKHQQETETQKHKQRKINLN